MKINKLMMAALFVGTLAFVGCNEKKDGNVPDEPNTKEEAPAIATPGQGFVTIALRVPAEQITEGGFYAIGSFNNKDGEANGWTAAKDFFTKVANAETWYQITLAYSGDMAVKVCAVPEVGDPGWGFQWGMNTVDKENVTVVAGTVTLDNSENDGEVKALGFEDNSVVFIDVDAWKASPKNKKPAATEAYIKYAPDWVFVAMEAKGANTFTYPMRYSDNGFNIADNAEGADASWFPVEKIVGMDGIEKGDSIMVTFVSEAGPAGTVSVELIEKGEVPEIPAGHGTFIVFIDHVFSGENLIFTGNFEEDAWGESKRVMMYNEGNNSWSWEGDYPENFEYKVIARTEGQEDVWAVGDNVKFDGETFEHHFSLQ